MTPATLTNWTPFPLFYMAPRQGWSVHNRPDTWRSTDNCVAVFPRYEDATAFARANGYRTVLRCDWREAA